MQEILSPLTKSSNVSYLRSVNVKDIVKKYKKFNINVEKYFIDLYDVSVYLCRDTGYEFYYPFNLGGNSIFYEHFQSFDWYYSSWKWEHEITTQYIKNKMKILEVGCGQGAFLERICKLFDLNHSIGLELNESAKKETDTWKIMNQSIQDFAKIEKELFDIVCSFQVLEHISDVHSFLNAKVKCLKKGGTLIISVPNNDSFIKDIKIGLNTPPHHMGLWNKKSLTTLKEIFPIRLEKIYFENLQDVHVRSYVEAKYYSKFPKILNKIFFKFSRIVGLYNYQIRKTNSNRNQLLGHTILAVYKKEA